MNPKTLLEAFKLAISEIKQLKLATREVIKEFIEKFIKWIILKHRCSKILDKMKQVKNYQEWEEYAKLLD